MRDTQEVSPERPHREGTMNMVEAYHSGDQPRVKNQQRERVRRIWGIFVNLENGEP